MPATHPLRHRLGVLEDLFEVTPLIIRAGLRCALPLLNGGNGHPHGEPAASL